MASVTRTVWSSYSSYTGMTLTLQLDSVSNGSVANSSTVSYRLYITRKNSATYKFAQQNRVTLTLNGATILNTYSWGEINLRAIPNEGTITLASGQITVNHEADGTKSMAYAATFYQPQYQPQINFSLSGSMTLDAIPRESAFASVPSGTLGQQLTIGINHRSSSFTDTLTYTCGSASGTIVSGSTASSVVWTPPVSLAAQNTAGTSVTATLTLKTYSGSTLIGTKSAACALAIPESVTPAVTSVAVEEANTLPVSGVYVQGKSALTVTVTPDMSADQSAEVRSVTVKVGDTTYQAVQSGNVYTATSGALTASGTVAVTATVVDTRGRTATQTVQVTVQAYAAPTAALTGFRCNGQGAADETGEYVSYAATGGFSSAGGQNTYSATLKYGRRGQSQTVITTTTTAGTFSGIQSGISEDYAYTFTLEVTDAWTTVSKTLEIPVGFVLMDFHVDGKGVAFGKVSEADGFECALDAEFTGKFTADGIKQLRGVTLIPNGSDLNSYNSEGEYYVSSSANAQTILNTRHGAAASSSAAAFRLTVEKSTNTVTGFTQWYWEYSNMGVWRRYTTNTGSTWSNWTQVQGNFGSKANLASPSFTGTPKAPTAVTGTNTTQIATTAFVQTEIASKIPSYADYSKTTLTGASNRVGSITGGYKQIGNIVFVVIKCTAAVSLAANDYWTIIEGFPVPVIQQALAASRHEKAGAMSAYISTDGKLVIGISSAIAANDLLLINGSYFTA